MKNRLSLLIASILLVLAQATRAQYSVSGTVLDTVNSSPLSNISISVLNGNEGTVTDINGHFNLKIKRTISGIKLSSIGYKDLVISLEFGEKNFIELGTIYLSPALIGLEEIRVIAPEAIDRQTPVAATTITAAQISQRLGDEPFPEVMKMVPGVYATREGGGSGDASVNIRGFKQENVALLLNGVPIDSPSQLFQ